MPATSEQEINRKTLSTMRLNKIIEHINNGTSCTVTRLESGLAQQGGKRKNNSKNNTKKRKPSRKNNRKRRASKNKRN